MTEFHSGHRYHDRSREDSEHPSEAIYLGKSSVLGYFQYESGLCYDLETGGSLSNQFEHLGPAEDFSLSPCLPENHEFETTFEEWSRSTICAKCGWSADSLRLFNGQEFLKETVPFLCPICKTEKAEDEVTIIYHDDECRRLCQNCKWEYSLEAHMRVEELEDYLIVCRGAATSISEQMFPTPDAGPQCNWIAKATQATVSSYFAERSGYEYRETPHTTSPCPACGDDGELALALLRVDSWFGRALADTLDTEPEQLTDELFKESVEFRIPDEWHEDLINKYHEIEREEARRIAPKYRQQK